MRTTDPDYLFNEYDAGRMSRRQLIARLTALGAAAAGLGGATRRASGAHAADAPTFSARSIDHIALNVTDVPRSRDWYVRHLGMRVTSEDATTCFLDCGRDFLALFKSDRPGLHHYSYGIDDYNQQEAARRLREAGLAPKLRGSRIYFDDPDGIEVQVSRERA